MNGVTSGLYGIMKESGILPMQLTIFGRVLNQEFLKLITILQLVQLAAGNLAVEMLGRRGRSSCGVKL